MPAPQERAERASMVLWVGTLLIALVGTALTLMAWGDLILADSLSNVAGALAGVVYATLGALIVRRARNLIGWLLQGVGLGFAFLSLTDAYAVFGIATHPGSVPAPEAVGAIAEWAFVVTAPSLAFMLFFFPTGTLPSPRWRPILMIGIVAVALTSIGFLVNPVPLALPAPGGALRVPNPLGIESRGGLISTILVLTVWATVLTVAAAFVALVSRYRAGGRELRQQIKWVAFVSALALLANVIAIGALVACGCDSSPVATVMFAATVLLVFFGMPAALAIAILRYRLYEIDVIINKAVAYGLLAAAVTAVYVVVVVGFGSLVGYGTGSPVLTTATAVAIALLFQPFRRQAQRVANRLVFGERATPYQVLSDFAERMGGTYGLDDVVLRMAEILAQGTGAKRVDVWLRVGRELRRAASWPEGGVMPGSLPLGQDDALPPFVEVTRAVAVRHDEDLLGALTLEKPRSEPLTPTEDKLLQDLASQAGLVLRNVRLAAELQVTIDELRASRRRLVEAQDDERRRIERNLHDGAQQQLVALNVQLGLLARLADDPERVRQAATQLQDALREALDDLRNLARGIYPPLLADEGLVAALQAQSRRAAVSTTIAANGIGRYPREVEAAVYFCVLEALQNVAKYAEAGAAVVSMAERDGSLVFTIEDDGRGFDASATRRGTGLQGMADRVDAIGGTLDVRSTPGQGTRVQGEIKLA
jgi:signal transduction histidine kinase